MTGMRGVVVVGSFNIDHVWLARALPAAGETIAGSYATGPGGKGFNQAMASARSGAATSFVCALGDDAGAALARKLAAGDGISLFAAPGRAPTGAAGIFVDGRGRNSIVFGAGANADLDRGFIVAQAQSLASAAVVLVQLESPLDAVAAALGAGRAQGAITVLNPAPAPRLDSGDRQRLLADVDLLTPNESEFARLLDAPGFALSPDRVAGMDDHALHVLCRRLLPRGSVVITLGAAGAFVSHPDDARRGDTHACYRMAAERVEPIDTTGAGDAFNGALAASLARTAGRFQDAVRYAGRYAALSTERSGAALAMPRLAEVEGRFG